MNLSTHLIVTFSLIFAITPLAQADGYWRASSIYVVPDDDTAEEAVGATVALGAKFRIPYSDNTNHFEVEGGWAEWNTDLGYNAGNLNDKITFIPVLINLRHELAITDTLRLAIGPSLGASYINASGALTTPGQDVSADDWVFTYGGGASFYLTISESISMSIGYRYLFNEDANLTVEGSEVTLTDLNTHVFELGLRFAWPY